MKTAHAPLADPMKILTRTELATVLAELNRKAPRSVNTRLNRTVFRLSACCGLRASEIAQLQMGDVHTELPRPHLRIRAGAAKGNRPRVVPLWWDAGTLADITAWQSERLQQVAKPAEPLVASQRPGRLGTAGCTSIVAVANASEAPQRAQRPLPGMFSNWQLGHCMFRLISESVLRQRVSDLSAETRSTRLLARVTLRDLGFGLPLLRSRGSAAL